MCKVSILIASTCCSPVTTQCRFQCVMAEVYAPPSALYNKHVRPHNNGRVTFCPPPRWVTFSKRRWDRQTDRRTDISQTVTSRFPLDSARLIISVNINLFRTKWQNTLLFALVSFHRLPLFSEYVYACMILSILSYCKSVKWVLVESFMYDMF